VAAAICGHFRLTLRTAQARLYRSRGLLFR
jgi:hypothetical protein